MIGVIADSSDREVVHEFFELFKTPWEFYRKERRYDAVICAGEEDLIAGAKLVLLYSGRPIGSETACEQRRGCMLSREETRLPIYGEAVTFPDRGGSLLTEERSQQCAAYRERSGERVLVRVGYDLFAEVRALLTEGQPVSNAGIPALELHIAFLRDWITGSGLAVAEIPPVPEGYRFIACLTHDVDHPSIRQHKWDHTMFGFLSRAVIGSVRDLVRGRLGVRGLLRNWAAALKLPLVHLGLAKDFWRDFGDRYLELEKGLPSTFFVIPFKNRPGRRKDGPAPGFRAAQYGAKDLADTIQKLVAAGCEVSLHGLDAWLDESRGNEELEEIHSLTSASKIGVRMHWLYYDRESPLVLEQAGAVYDSTVGYNGTVGYRAGTTQVYQPLEATRLLELPLHAMDTALFYPAHLGLAPREAQALLSRLVENVATLGGCLTVNWHDRSIAPERQWDGCYRDLIEELTRHGAWFATAGQATSWFQKRRSARFEADPAQPGAVRARIAGDQDEKLPGLRLRMHNAKSSADPGAEAYVDRTLGVGNLVACGAGR